MPNKGSIHNKQTRPHVLSFISGKGGVGKSVLAFNMAELVARAGYRVLLVDTDFYGSNQHILANVKAEYGCSQYFDRTLGLVEAVTKVTEKLDLLASVHGIVPFEDSDTRSAAHFVAGIREDAKTYDLVVIDHCSGISNASTVMAHASDCNVLVTIPELTAISDAYGLTKHLVKTNNTIDCRLIINRSHDDEEAEFISGKFSAVSLRFLEFAPVLAGIIPESELFRQGVARQTTIAAIDPDSSACKSITTIAVNLGLMAGDMAKTFNSITNNNTAIAEIRN